MHYAHHIGHLRGLAAVQLSKEYLMGRIQARSRAVVSDNSLIHTLFCRLDNNDRGMVMVHSFWCCGNTLALHQSQGAFGWDCYSDPEYCASSVALLQQLSGIICCDESILGSCRGASSIRQGNIEVAAADMPSPGTSCRNMIKAGLLWQPMRHALTSSRGYANSTCWAR